MSIPIVFCDIVRALKNKEVYQRLLSNLKHNMTHYFAWGNNPKRRTLKGRQLKILAVGKMKSCLVEFKNGQKEIVSIRALRKIK